MRTRNLWNQSNRNFVYKPSNQHTSYETSSQVGRAVEPSRGTPASITHIGIYSLLQGGYEAVLELAPYQQAVAS